MNHRYELYPDGRSNEFGSANNLEASGGIFDSNQDVETGELPSFAQDENKASVRRPERRQSFAAAPERNAVESAPADTSASPGKTEDKDAADRENKGNNSRVGIRIKLIGAICAVSAIAVMTLIFFLTHAVLGELFGKHDIYSSGATVINLSGSDYSDYSQLSKVKSLEVVDLTNSAFRSLSDLYGCRNLKKVILGDRELSAEECIDFYRHIPEAIVICRININGEIYNSDVTEIKVNDADADTQKLYASLNAAKTIDMTSCSVSDDTYAYLCEALPDCAVVIRTSIGGTEYTTDADSLVLSGTLTEEDAVRVRYFRKLKRIDLTKCQNPDILNDYFSSHRDVRLNTPMQFLQKQVGSEDEMIDLRGSRYTLEQVRKALDENLAKMKSLNKIDMCGCGLSDSEMEQLCGEYPDIKFVWIVHFNNYSVRTDAVAFSAADEDGNEVHGQDDFEMLFKYCRDIRGLDLSHCEMTDISGIASMKKLRAVIFSDNLITDISVFSRLPELEYIEMNAGNRVKLADPLRGLQNLRYVNFWSNLEMTDLSPLYDHEKLEIAIFHYSVPQKEREWFKKSNPYCNTFYKVDSNMISTNQMWRDNLYRKKLRKATGDWMHVVGFNEETGEYIFDYNTDQYKYM